MSLLIFQFVNHWLFLKLYQIMELKNSLSTVPGFLYLSIWSHAHLLTELVKMETLCIPLDTWGWFYLTWFDVQGCNISVVWVFLTLFEFSSTFALSSVDFSCSTWVQFSSSSCLYFWFSWAYSSSSKEEDSSRHNHLVWIQRFTCTCHDSTA